MWSSALSASDIAALAAGASANGIEASTLQCYYKFSGGSSEPDLSGNSRTGTVTATVTPILGPSGTSGTGVQGTQGDKGGLRYYFDSTNSAGVGSNGSLRMDNGTIGSVANLYVNVNDVNGVSFASFLSHWADSTSTIKGYVLIKENSNAGTPFSIFSVSAVANHTTYYTVSVAYVAGTIPANGDALVVEWIRQGDKGDTGATGSQGSQGPPGGGGPTSLTLSSNSATYLGDTAFPATATIAPGANHVLHLRLSAYRSATTVRINLCVCKDSTNGYVFAAQEDGNLVNYYCTSGTEHAINASGSGTDDLKGPIMLDLWMPIGNTADNGIGMGGYYSSPNIYRVWPVSGKRTDVDMTGTLTIAVRIDAVANVNRLDYEIL